ncbi:protein LSD1-like [Gossypium australe]|uniref:Protein LSD1-like n=1 Tax=Gossypium australe TaxID=47621 RepID=A0A5B6WBC3_9ROSI|nr:protein LSD1-like [Gossypium australe]
MAICLYQLNAACVRDLDVMFLADYSSKPSVHANYAESNYYGLITKFVNKHAGMEMAQLICGGCRTLLMYTRGAASIRCSCCHTINVAPASNQISHITCGHCRTTLMYPYGAPSVKCAVCQYVTNVGMGNVRVPLPVNRPNGKASTGSMATPSASPSQTVVVENPMSVDESGKLVSNVVVGITTGKK